MRIQQAVLMIQKVKGTSARVSLNGTKLAEMAKKEGGDEVAEVISGLVKKHPKLKADVAYKASEQGFTVGAMTLRDGKKVLGTGSMSVTGAGTEEALVKARLNIGEKGEILSYRGYTDLAHTPKVQDIEAAITYKNGILEGTNKCGEFSGSRYRVDIPKTVEAAGLKEEGTVLLKDINKGSASIIDKIRNAFAGKYGEQVHKPEINLEKKLNDLEKVIKDLKQKKADIIKNFNEIENLRPGSGKTSAVDWLEQGVRAHKPEINLEKKLDNLEKVIKDLKQKKADIIKNFNEIEN